MTTTGRTDREAEFWDDHVVPLDVCLAAIEKGPDPNSAAKDLGVLNIAGALPFALAPALAPVVLGLSDTSYSVLYLVAGACALLGAVAIIPIRRVR